MAAFNEFILIYFNPLPRKEGDSLKYKLFGQKLYFNPLPRKEGDRHKRF